MCVQNYFNFIRLFLKIFDIKDFCILKNDFLCRTVNGVNRFNRINHIFFKSSFLENDFINERGINRLFN